MVRRIRLYRQGTGYVMSHVRLTPYPVHARVREVRRSRTTDLLRLWNRRYVMNSLRTYLRAPRRQAERVRYAAVQIGILPEREPKRFMLIYGLDDHGTGPFRTRAEAIGWFARGGR